MKHVLIIAAAALLLTILGCEKKEGGQANPKDVGRTAYNKDIDGGKGMFIAQPDPKVLEDQAKISKKREEALTAVVASAPAGGSTTASAPAPTSGPEATTPPASAPAAP